MTISEFREERGISEEQMSDEEIRAAFPDEIDEDGDDELVRAAEAAIDRMYDYESGGNGASRRPEVNPQAGENSSDEKPEGEGGFKRQNGDSKDEVSLKRDYLETEGAMALHTIKMLQAERLGNPAQRNDHFHKLARGGHYGDRVQKNVQSRAEDYYQTLVDDAGGVLLPLTVREEIDRLAENVGVFRQFARTVSGITGTERFPASSQNLEAVFVQEGEDIQIDRRSFEGVDLDPRKMVKGHAWTLETENEDVAQEILADAQEAIADGFARKEDNTGINGDGTSSFGNINGILNETGTTTKTLASGNTSYTDIDADDLRLAFNDLPAGNREIGSGRQAFIFDETMQAHFATLKDNNGQYLKDGAFNQNVSPNTLWGVPVFYTEVMNGTDKSSQADTDFGILALRDKWIMGFGGQMTTSTLTEATVKDQNDNDIRLGSQDLTAQIFRQYVDIGTNFPESAVIFHTAAS